MAGLNFHERQHIQKLFQQQGSIKYIFDEFVKKSGLHLSGWKATDSDNIWTRNTSIEKAIETELSILETKLKENIVNYSTDSWKRSHLKNDDFISEYIKGMPLNDVAKKGMFSRNEEALKTFLNRKIDGFTISDRVWDIKNGAKANLEFYLQSGLSTGRPAALIGQDIRQLLENPDRRFHRIRNANGKLVPSAPMKDYHPGTGVYRSSAQNAKRLAATNTNEMYRITDHERWQKLDFILGIEVKRSASNRGPCPICDSMVGKYPKEYLFKGNHPWCICTATPILADEDAFIDSIVNDTPVSGERVTDIPSNAREYLEAQLAKDNISPKSYLFKDNQQFFDGSKGVKTVKSEKHEELSRKFISERNLNKRAEFMSPISVESLKDSKILMLNDGKTGCVVAPDGDLQSVYNNAEKGEGAEIVKLAIKHGAKKLDCFDNFLPEYYSKFGFKEVSRVKWDDKYAPKNWDYKKYGRPDVIFMEI